MLRLDGTNVIYNNSENLGAIETLTNTGEGFSISLPDGSTVFIPEEDCTKAEREVFAVYHEVYAATGGLPPVATQTLDQLKQAKIQEIRTVCNAEILTGFTSSAKGTPELYDLDYEDQINLEALKNNVMQGLIPDGTLEYYVKGGPCEIWTNAEFMALYTDAMNFKMLRIRKAKQLIAQVEAAVDAAGVGAIVW